MFGFAQVKIEVLFPAMRAHQYRRGEDVNDEVNEKSMKMQYFL